MNLTKKEHAVIGMIMKTADCYADITILKNGNTPEIWVGVMWDYGTEEQKKIVGSPKGIPGVMSSLNKKGFAVSCKNVEGDTCYVTAAGVTMYNNYKKYGFQLY